MKISIVVLVCVLASVAYVSASGEDTTSTTTSATAANSSALPKMVEENQQGAAAFVDSVDTSSPVNRYLGEKPSLMTVVGAWKVPVDSPEEAHKCVEHYMDIFYGRRDQTDIFDDYHTLTNEVIKRGFIRRFINSGDFIFHLLWVQGGTNGGATDSDIDLKLYLGEVVKNRACNTIVKNIVKARPSLKAYAIQVAQGANRPKLVAALKMLPDPKDDVTSAPNNTGTESP